MSSASKFFKQAQASDIAYRISQYRTLLNTGTNKTQIGIVPSGKGASPSPKENKIIAGETVVGGNEVVG